MLGTLFQNRLGTSNHLPANGRLMRNNESFFTEQGTVIGIIIASISYQAILCMLNTQTHMVSRAIVGLSEGLIVLACLPLLARRMLPGVLILLLLSAALLTISSIISGELMLKAFRDLLIPLCFFWAGYNVGRADLAERALKVAIAVIISFGLFEFFFVDKFTNLFDIFGYYVSTGSLVPITDYVRDSKLQMNGIRPEGIGRTLFPGLLGSHRVSSVFLEPISMGNFATMCAAWGLSKDTKQIRQMLWFLGAAFVMMVLSDSRFALMSVSLMILARLTLKGTTVNLVVLAPFVATIMLLIMGMDATGRGADSFGGRLSFSGFTLLHFDLPLLFGLSGMQNFGDQGYAYVLSSFGLPVALLFWFSLWLVKMPDDQSLRFRAFISIYLSLILCISGNSAFAFKTSAVVWFLIGSCLKNPAPNGQRNISSGEQKNA
ncbi:MAG: polysaccharide biosynthesis protein GumE [Gammaproteobacteria bacterium]|nr:MAG: polysaccharide biosynthesis protein GumE [Gammaproteobacteria bacterium]